ncbi:proline dehydrogenase [Ascoidea rubescens DSM 1968]|uniref:Proline dehydrogenase n=1 Tax=Ascoidea rubescens DSM 1968 TaxID=1344418 RepID=A0A1D2VE58_9ASCO|nr:FAD-linked oxidoreductase [Ascoidea rubescens DSM 1968]ODV59872.1 FAD-linked oxidoreductase [Ascoidea rubescens DSM 1968]
MYRSTALIRKNGLKADGNILKSLVMKNNKIRFISTTQKNSNLTTTTLLSNSNPGSSSPNLNNDNNKLSTNIEFLDTLNKQELFQLSCIGIATLNKFVLNSVIKLFPYIPMKVIKGLVYQYYCGGETFNDVVETGKRLSERGIDNMMISLTIEDCNGEKNIDIDYIVDESIKSIDHILVPNLINQSKNINQIPPGYIALKPTALVSDPKNVLKNFNHPDYEKQRNELIENCSKIIEHACNKNIELSKQFPDRKSPFIIVVIDAESFELQQNVYILQRILSERFNKDEHEFISVVGTIQMYLKQSYDMILKELELASKNNYKIGLKLVRGAYLHTEPNRAQVIHDTKEDTDSNYNKGISFIINEIIKKGNNSTCSHLVVASHNDQSLVKTTNLLKKNSSLNSNNIVLGQLLGMADDIGFKLINEMNAKNIIKYVPWGPPFETKEYLKRRLEENGDSLTSRTDTGLGLLKGVVKTITKRLF